MSSIRTMRFGMSSVVAIALVTILAAPAMAQQPAAADPNPGNMTVTAGLDLPIAYMFRGIRQDDTKLIMQPYLDLGLAVYSGDSGLKSAAINIGSWNSLHTGDTGSNGPSGKLWYEGDFYATVDLAFGRGVSLGTTYTAYTSPNNMFSTVKELAFRIGFDDTPYLGAGTLKPYALLAFEIDTSLGSGQRDAGASAGRYLELGVEPGWAAPAASLVFPVKMGLSLSGYYELNVGTARAPVFHDSNFGYLSVAGIATVPLGGTTSFGAWNVHGGLEFQVLGDTTEAINGGDASKLIGSIGVGLSY